MRRMFLILLLVVCSGCVTVKTPRYIQDEAPYKKKYFADFDQTYKAVVQALADTGWVIEDTTNPAVYEQSAEKTDPEMKQVLFLTQVRQTPIFLTSKYMNLNVILRSLDDGTEVEIRYAAVTPAFFKNIRTYRNDAVVNRVFGRISDLIAE